MSIFFKSFTQADLILSWTMEYIRQRIEAKGVYIRQRCDLKVRDWVEWKGHYYKKS